MNELRIAVRADVRHLTSTDACNVLRKLVNGGSPSLNLIFSKLARQNEKWHGQSLDYCLNFQIKQNLEFAYVSFFSGIGFSKGNSGKK